MLRRPHAVLTVVLAMVLAVVVRPSNAQSPLPTTILPNVRLQGAPPVAPPPEAPPPPAVPEGAVTAAPPGAEAIRFRLTEFVIDGMTAYPADRFQPLYQKLLDTDVSLAQLYGIAADIQKTYRDDGYFLSRVIIPEQTISGGRFHVQVIEGFINRLQFEGDIGPSEDLVRRYLDNVIGERPLRLATLERYLLLCNDIPGISAQGILKPSRDELGAADLYVRLGRKAFDAQVVGDNYGSKYTGEWETTVSGASNAFTPLGERISLTGLLSKPFSDPFDLYANQKNQWVTQLATSWRVGSKGVFFEALASYGVSRPGFKLKDFDFDSRTLLVNVDVGFPFVRSRDLSIIGRIGFDWENLDTDVFGNETFTRDRTRILYLDTHGEYRDRWRGSNAADLQLRQGIPVLDATTENSNYKSTADGTNAETVVVGSISRLQPVIDDIEVPGGPVSVALYGTAGGQYAFFNSLLASELFEVGMSQYGRGYDLGEISGDYGIGYTGELQLTQRLGIPYIPSYQLFFFFDSGYVWNRSGVGSDHLSSAGAGLRTTLLRHLAMELTVAKPISRPSERTDFTKDPQVLFRAVAQF
jgi:hemolysin activation/secretion protein